MLPIIRVHNEETPLQHKRQKRLPPLEQCYLDVFRVGVLNCAGESNKNAAAFRPGYFVKVLGVTTCRPRCNL